METSPKMIRFEWCWNWKVLLFAFVFLPLTIQLGFWQISRAEEKQQMLSAHQQRAEAPLVDLRLVSSEGDRQYLRVEVKGHYDNRATLLLDNRVRRGLPGYEVISVFRAEGLSALLVNRGWIAASLDRSVLPKVPLLEQELTISGYLYQSPGQQLMLGSDPWRADKALQIVQNAAPKIAANRFDEPLYDYTLRLDETAPGALQTGWHVVNVQPGKHQGYAVQWFVLAGVLVLLTVMANSNLSELWRARRHGRKNGDNQ